MITSLGTNSSSSSAATERTATVGKFEISAEARQYLGEKGIELHHFKGGPGAKAART